MTHIKNILHIIILFWLFGSYTNAQSTLKSVSLDSCVWYGQQHFPLLKQKMLIDESTRLKIENIDRAVWPQLSLQGQATIQSEVTGIPLTLPNIEIPTLSKDQYRLYGEVNQSITDLFTKKDHKNLALLQGQTEQKKWSVESFVWEEKVMDLFFQILFIQRQEEQLLIKHKDLDAGIQSMTSAVENGVALATSLDQLKAEKIKTDQTAIELAAFRKGLTESLSELIGKEIAPNAEWIVPGSPESIGTGRRPEIVMLDSQLSLTEAQWKLTEHKKLPRLGAYFQYGAGRPGLNMLSNDFDMFWIGGLRLQWNFSSWYTLNREKKLIQIQKQLIETQKDHFTVQLSSAEKRLIADRDKYNSLLDKDRELLAVREKIQDAATRQLESGIITANDFVNFVNQTDLARQNVILHTLQLRKSEYQLNHSQGHSIVH